MPFEPIPQDGRETETGWRKWSDIKKSKMPKESVMPEVTRFEDKVRDALRAVMIHAVRGDEKDVQHTFCSDPAHALHILAEHGIRPVNAHTVDALFDTDSA